MSLAEKRVDKLPEIAKSIDQIRYRIACWRSAGDRIAFVPTMGNLHAGHIALVAAARKKADRVVVSIFVNPTQFAITEDLDTYPRTFDEDISKLAKNHVDLVFSPDVNVLYDGGVGAQVGCTVDVPELSSNLEGEHRPGFFRGVATVVNKLFNIVQPDIAIFGEKDYQQLIVVKRMVSDLAMPIEIGSIATVREADGLALSSRNGYLDDDQRKIAAGLNKCLKGLVESAINSGDLNYAVVHASQQLEDQGFLVDYVVIRRQSDLGVPVSGDKSLIALAAVRLGSTRLIDNVPFELKR